MHLLQLYRNGYSESTLFISLFWFCFLRDVHLSFLLKYLVYLLFFLSSYQLFSVLLFLTFSFSLAITYLSLGKPFKNSSSPVHAKSLLLLLDLFAN